MLHTKEFCHWLRTLREDEFTPKAAERFVAESRIDGWAAAGLMYVLNHAITHCLASDESYLEIGTYAGRSLIGGLKDNAATAHVIDNFWDSPTLRSTFEDNLRLFGVRDRVTLHAVDAESFDAVLPKIGVFLYDANHDRGYTHFNLKRFERYLSDEAIVIVDDLKIEAGVGHKCMNGYSMQSRHPVLDDVQQWCAENQYSVTPLAMTPWTFGQAIMLYRR
ncbi:MAG: class I SAM-dependent methyltransferase [Nitrososphaera sp.]|nr:class I SAM-dependent methyltransferase [Nitrososphaera sp.]